MDDILSFFLYKYNIYISLSHIYIYKERGRRQIDRQIQILNRKLQNNSCSTIWSPVWQPTIMNYQKQKLVKCNNCSHRNGRRLLAEISLWNFFFCYEIIVYRPPLRHKAKFGSLTHNRKQLKVREVKKKKRLSHTAGCIYSGNRTERCSCVSECYLSLSSLSSSSSALSLFLFISPVVFFFLS